MKLATCGSNNMFQAGTATANPRNLTPVATTVFDDNIEQACAFYHSVLARTAEGRVQGIGGNAWGQLGDGTHENKAYPVDPGLSDVVKIAAGGAHAMALDAYDIVSTWGAGPLGDGKDRVEGEGSNIPLPVAKGNDIYTGANVFVVLGPDGRLTIWGGNKFGQLGDGTKTDKLSPFVLPLSVKQVAAGGSGANTVHTLFLTPEGRVLACGANNVCQSGQIASKPIVTPTLVPDLENVSKVFAGFSASAALTSDGKLYGWGKLPNGAVTSIPALLLEGVSDAFLSTFCIFAVVEGAVLGAGNNDSGQLGDGTKEDKPTFVEAQGLWGVETVSVGQADDNTHVAYLHLGELASVNKLVLTPLAGALQANWVFGPTLKPWQVKHRVALRHEDWIKDPPAPPNGRVATVGGLESGVEYEVYVQNGDFGWVIGRATPL